MPSPLEALSVVTNKPTQEESPPSYHQHPRTVQLLRCGGDVLGREHEVGAGYDYDGVGSADVLYAYLGDARGDGLRVAHAAAVDPFVYKSLHVALPEGVLAKTAHHSNFRAHPTRHDRLGREVRCTRPNLS